MPALSSSLVKTAAQNQPVHSQLNENLHCFITRLLPLTLGVILTSIAGCQPATQNNPHAAQSPTNLPSKNIVTTSYPLQWVTQQITGNEYQVNFPADDSARPDHWRPDRATIAEIQAAELIICNGVAAPYASWMKTVSLPSSKVIESASKGMSLSDFISVEDIRLVHSHGPEGEHSHATMVSRTWLHPAMLAKQARFITDELCKRFPDDTSAFQQNLTALQTTLEATTPQPLQEQTKPIFAATPELKFLTKAVGANDLHFNWNENTTLAEVEASFASQDQTPKPSYILFPQRLAVLAVRIQPALQQQKLTPIFVDMLDQPAPNRDFMSRLQANFEQMQKLVPSTDSKPPAE